MPVKTGQFMKLYKIIVSFFFTGSRSVFETQSNIYSGAFFRKKLAAKKAPP